MALHRAARAREWLSSPWTRTFKVAWLADDLMYLLVAAGNLLHVRLIDGRDDKMDVTAVVQYGVTTFPTMNRLPCRAVQFRTQPTGIAVARTFGIMLDLFKIDPDQVRWDLEETADRTCRLTIYHAHGSIAESFRTMESALARIDALEDLLLDALEDSCTSSESPR